MHSVKLLIQIPAWITSTDFESDHILTCSPENVSQYSASDAGVSYHQVSALKKFPDQKKGDINIYLFIKRILSVLRQFLALQRPLKIMKNDFYFN